MKDYSNTKTDIFFAVRKLIRSEERQMENYRKEYIEEYGYSDIDTLEDFMDFVDRWDTSGDESIIYTSGYLAGLRQALRIIESR